MAGRKMILFLCLVPSALRFDYWDKSRETWTRESANNLATQKKHMKQIKETNCSEK